MDTLAQSGDRITRITRIVSDHLEIEPDEIAPTDRFVEDHGADSLALIGVLAALEAEFKVGIDQSELRRMTDISSVEQVIAEIGAR
ncbi:acyl carrier protein [Streptacidiphilus sp. N1-12]|uniref:Acyl carrier protein n=2 Tax=Streptacidiphilus alkalitolerans TaxID=3342712 RepID=A0ABV6WEC3_9ACTN